MTIAVCFKCGHIKFGALCPCDKCNTAPLSAKEKSLSMILSEIYLKGDDMNKYSILIKGGTVITLDKRTEDMWIDHFSDDEECMP